MTSANRVVPSPLWNYSTSKLPDNEELIATIANGFLGTRIFSDTIYAAGVFNGDHLTSHRARIPSSLPTKLSVNLQTPKAEQLYTLDIQNGVFLQSLTASDNSYAVTQKTYAHGYYRNLLVTEVQVKTNVDKGISVLLESNMGASSSDISFSSEILQGIQ